MLNKRDRSILWAFFFFNVVVGCINLYAGSYGIGAFEIIGGAGAPLFVLLKTKAG
jgi:hypothetical protein